MISNENLVRIDAALETCGELRMSPKEERWLEYSKEQVNNDCDIYRLAQKVIMQRDKDRTRTSDSLYHIVDLANANSCTLDSIKPEKEETVVPMFGGGLFTTASESENRDDEGNIYLAEEGDRQVERVIRQGDIEVIRMQEITAINEDLKDQAWRSAEDAHISEINAESSATLSSENAEKTASDLSLTTQYKDESAQSAQNAENSNLASAQNAQKTESDKQATLGYKNETEVARDLTLQYKNDAASSAEEAAISADKNTYQGLWPDTGGSALKGNIWQTQKSGMPTGYFFVALMDTAKAPENDGVNWSVIINDDYVNNAQGEIVGGGVFPITGAVSNGDIIPEGCTHLRVFNGESLVVVEMSPVSSGLVSFLSSAGATIGGISVSLKSFSTASIKHIKSRKNTIGSLYLVHDRDNAMIEIAPPLDSEGAYIGEDENGNKLRLIHENKLKTSWFGNGYDAYNLAMSAAVDLNLDLEITEYRYRVSDTFVIGAPDGKSYGGAISCNIYVEPTLAMENVVEFRNFNGKVGDVWANAIDLADVAINKVNSARMQYGKLRGRRGKRWGVVVDSSTGNNSGSTGGSLRAENSGSNLQTSLSYVSNEGSASPSQRSNVLIGDEVNSDAVVIEIGGTDFLITDIGQDGKSIKVYPAIPENLQSEIDCVVYQGGGIKYKGADTGVCNVAKATIQANAGVGAWMGSLYGQCYSTGIFELNHGPDIICGSTTTGFSAKNTITSAYFEPSRSSERILMLSPNAKLSILDAFNLNLNSVKNLYDHIVGINGRSQNVSILDDNHSILRHPFKYLFDIAGTTTLTLYQAESQFLSSSLGVTSDFNLVLKSLSGKHRDTKTEFHFYNFASRDIVITDQDGGTINGQSSLRVTTPGNGVLYLFRDRYGNANKWIANLVKSDI